jgi:hypothetical protein
MSAMSATSAQERKKDHSEEEHARLYLQSHKRNERFAVTCVRSEEEEQRASCINQKSHVLWGKRRREGSIGGDIKRC